MASKADKAVLWLVGHPAHSTAYVLAEDWETATVKAAEQWDVPWRTVAAFCELKGKKTALRNICGKCGEMFFGELPLCDRCKVVAAQEERNFVRNMKATWYLGRKRA